MKISIVGAGGIGGYYGGLLARAGNQVSILARGEHLQTIRERGLEVIMPGDRFTAKVIAAEWPEELAGAELAIVAVKSYSLPEVVPAIRMLGEKGSVVLPLLNGVDTVQKLVEGGVPKDTILGGLTTISVVKTTPGVIERRSSFAKLVLGEPSGGISERANRIADVFVEAGVDAKATENITLELWRKFAFIATLAASCGLARVAIGPVRNAPQGDLLLERSVREIAAVANAQSVRFAEADIQQTLTTIQGLAPEMKPSFLLDLERGGPTELEILSGAISRMGKESRIQTPVHDTATAALAAAIGAAA